MLQQFKVLFRDHLGMPSWAVLVVVGLLAHLALTLVLRKSVTSGWGLLGPLALGLVLEAYEIWLQYREVGLFTVGNDPLVLILARHGLDVVIMLALPILLVVLGAVTSR